MKMDFGVSRVERGDGWWVVVRVGSRREEHGPYASESIAAEEEPELFEELQLRTGDGDRVTLLPLWVVVRSRRLGSDSMRDVLADAGLDVAVTTLSDLEDASSTFLVLAVHPANQDPHRSAKLASCAIDEAGMRSVVALIDESMIADVLDDAAETAACTTVGSAAMDAFRESDSYGWKRRWPSRAARPAPFSANGHGEEIAAEAS
jgi:hypothetical protein